MVLELWSLVFLMMAIPASSFALVWCNWGFLFSFLDFHILPSTWETSHTKGSSSSSFKWPKSRRTSCLGLRAGTWRWRWRRSQSATSLFWGQVTRAWWSWLGSVLSHWLQLGVGAFGSFIQFNLSCVGSKTTIICNFRPNWIHSLFTALTPLDSEGFSEHIINM